MSDPSQGNIGGYVRGGFKRSFSMKKSRSDTEGVDSSTDPDVDDNEVVAGTLQDGMGTNRSIEYCCKFVVFSCLSEVILLVANLSFLHTYFFFFICFFPQCSILNILHARNLTQKFGIVKKGLSARVVEGFRYFLRKIVSLTLEQSFFKLFLLVFSLGKLKFQDMFFK